MTLVVDSSVTLAWCFDDERSPAALAVLDAVATGHAYVPTLWRYEFSNGLLSAQRRGRIQPGALTALLNEFGGLDIREDSQPRSAHWQAVSALAEQFQLTAYDAAYLELAQRRQLPLATFNVALQRATIASGLNLFS